MRKIPVSVFASFWLGQIITFKPNGDFKEENERKNYLLEFVPDLLKQKRFMISGLGASIFILLINMPEHIYLGLSYQVHIIPFVCLVIL